MNKFVDVTVILPIHKLEENDISLFENAVKSIKNSNIKEHSILDWDSFIINCYGFGGDDIGNL